MIQLYVPFRLCPCPKIQSTQLCHTYGVTQTRRPSETIRLLEYRLSCHKYRGFLDWITVDGHVVAVRVNLERALRRIREESQTPQALWIDTLSINQDDFEEKSQQIRLMGRIYKSTSECVMWVGEVEEQAIEPFHRRENPDPIELTILKRLIRHSEWNTPEPLRLAGKETSSIDVPGAFEIMELVAQDKHFYEMPFFYVLPDGTIELCETWAKAVYALENILRRAWWTRIWTVQEAFLPSQAKVQVGPHCSPYKIFVRGAECWERHIWGLNSQCCSPIFNLWMGYFTAEIHPAIDGIVDLQTLQETRADVGRQSVAHNLFLLSIRRSALLNHDHVYGLLGLITEFFQIDEEPDYTSSPAKLYAATTLRFMENAKSLCLLPYARHNHGEATIKTETDFLHELPSWTPDWGTNAWGDYFDIYNYGGFTADRMLSYNGTHHNKTILRLEGIAVDKISKIGRAIDNMKVRPSEFVPVVQRWLNLVEAKGLSPRALWDTIHVATHKDIGSETVDHQVEWWKSLQAFARLGTSFEDVELAAKGTPFHFCLLSMGYMDRRGVFTTEPNTTYQNTVNPAETSEYRSAFPQGSVGVALSNVHEGDYIFAIKGGRTPLIFRPLTHDLLRHQAMKEGIPEEQLSRCFTFISVCYIHGMMQGQAVADSSGWEQIYLL